MFLKKFADALFIGININNTETRTDFDFIKCYFSIFQVPLAEATMSLELEISREIKTSVLVFFNIFTFPISLSPSWPTEINFISKLIVTHLLSPATLCAAVPIPVSAIVERKPPCAILPVFKCISFTSTVNSY